MLTGEYAGTQGLGLLRLHSTFRHDLKIYASDEGRVQMTAAAFAKVCFLLSLFLIHLFKENFPLKLLNCFQIFNCVVCY